MRLTANLSNPVKLMLPVQSLAKKYFPSRITQIKSISIAIPAHSEGRFAIVTNVGRGMRWTRLRLKTNGACADGEVVWSWRPDAGAKLCG